MAGLGPCGVEGRLGLAGGRHGAADGILGAMGGGLGGRTVFPRDRSWGVQPPAALKDAG